MKKTIIFLLFYLVSFSSASHAQVVIQEDFDDENIDYNLWNSNNYTYTPTESDGVLTVNIPQGTPASSGIDSNFLVVGDFDIQIDFNLIDFDSYWSSAVIDVIADDGSGRILVYAYAGSSPGYGYASPYYQNGTLIGNPYTTRYDQSGKLRVVRNGSQLQSYYWSNSTWNLLANASIFSSNAKLRFFSGSSMNNPSVAVDYDNILITTDSITFTPECGP